MCVVDCKKVNTSISCAKTKHPQDILSRIWKRQRTCLSLPRSNQWLKIGIEKDNFKMEVHALGYAVIRSVKEQRTRQ